jgi:cytochrome c oxidase accessory protein FixG
LLINLHTDTSDTENFSFRDRPATIDKQGRRVLVYPLKPRGRLAAARTVVADFLLVFFFVAPFLKIGGNPLLLFDIAHRQFFIFGLEFRPQDFYLLVLGVITLFVFIILFTAVFGRLFCGWVCPQTVLLEMLFRKVEFFFEGSGPRQRRFNNAPLTAGKLLRKTLKHASFILLALLIANTLPAYVIGGRRMLEYVSGLPTAHLPLFIFTLILSGAIYGIYARFREQVCTLICPYGRLQSVLLDSNSIVVAYDFKRGEPRRKPGVTAEPAAAGDCIDCRACVLVCPTGIDIRNGTQLECVNCTACIDVCNAVMDRTGRPRKLIRYASFAGITQGTTLRFTLRTGLYTVVLLVLLTVITLLAAGRSAVETTVLRTTGPLYQEVEGSIRNLYLVKVLNKTPDAAEVTLRLQSPEGELRVVGPALTPARRSSAESVFYIDIPRTCLFSSNTAVTIEVLIAGEVVETVQTTFSSPKVR